MSEILILARIRIHEYDLPIVTDYYFEVKDRLQAVEGFRGLSVWRDERDPEAFLVLYEYADVAAAQRGLIAISEIRVLAETQAADFRPADVQRLSLKSQTGQRIADTVRTSYLSLSQRIADPGYAPELIDEMERIFEELHFIPGCLGAIIGTNDILDEEVFGLVAWKSREAFLSSLPPGHKTYSISLYRRFY